MLREKFLRHDLELSGNHVQFPVGFLKDKFDFVFIQDFRGLNIFVIIVEMGMDKIAFERRQGERHIFGSNRGTVGKRGPPVDGEGDGFFIGGNLDIGCEQTVLGKRLVET
ncbi:MAG: hypothetical protein ACD_75C01058G0001 [uncultured bacterium]|nr:MAG: hypothetical protein ACD_75C01058G0001 [uncultured bacterium]